MTSYYSFDDKVSSSQLKANNNPFYFDYKNNEYGYNTSSSRGADTFHPFKSTDSLISAGYALAFARNTAGQYSYFQIQNNVQVSLYNDVPFCVLLNTSILSNFTIKITLGSSGTYTLCGFNEDTNYTIIGKGLNSSAINSNLNYRIIIAYGSTNAGGTHKITVSW